MIYARSGMRGHNVEQWQQNINRVRGKIMLSPALTVDGVFGSKTLSATIKIQKYIGVTPDGIVGDNTRTAFSKAFPYLSTGFIDPKHPDAPEFNEESNKRVHNTGKAKEIFLQKNENEPITKKSNIGPLALAAIAVGALFKLG